MQIQVQFGVQSWPHTNAYTKAHKTWQTKGCPFPLSEKVRERKTYDEFVANQLKTNYHMFSYLTYYMHTCSWGSHHTWHGVTFCAVLQTHINGFYTFLCQRLWWEIERLMHCCYSSNKEAPCTERNTVVSVLIFPLQDTLPHTHQTANMARNSL